MKKTPVTSYTYYIDGLRKSKRTGNVTTCYIWLDGNMVYEFTGNTSHKYLYGRSLVSSEAYRYVLDAHGNVVALVDGNNSVVKRYDYDAFGNELSQSANDTNPFRYCAEYYDKETDKVYLRARYYDLSDGRFTQMDTAKDGLNWYAYCENNPVGRIDSTGLDCWVFYDEDSFEKQAKTEADFLAYIYHSDVHSVGICSLESFISNWDSMVNSDLSIDGISLLFHGTPYTLYMGTDEQGNAQQLTSSTQEVTPSGKYGYYVGNLTKATMKPINLMSCNGGHLDLINANESMQEKGFNHNISVEFLLSQNTSIVYGMDGSLAYTNLWGNYYPRLSWNQESYYMQTPSRLFLGKRLPNGKIAFCKTDKGDIRTWPIWQK